MRMRIFAVTVAVGLALVATPAAAQLDNLGLTEANGCEFYIGTGIGQVVSTPGVEPLSTVGTVHLTARDGERSYTLQYESLYFAPQPLSATSFARRGFYNWRFEENGLRGTVSSRLVVTTDPALPGQASLICEGEIIGGNRFGTGGAHVVATMNYATGRYTITLFELMLCPE